MLRTAHNGGSLPCSGSVWPVAFLGAPCRRRSPQTIKLEENISRFSAFPSQWLWNCDRLRFPSVKAQTSLHVNGLIPPLPSQRWPAPSIYNGCAIFFVRLHVCSQLLSWGLCVWPHYYKDWGLKGVEGMGLGAPLRADSSFYKEMF